MFRKKSASHQVAEGLEPIYPRLWRYCMALAGNIDQANDLAQASCLRALEKSDYFKPDTHLDRWIFTIAQRLWINELRYNAVRRGMGTISVEEIDIPDSSSDQETNIFAKQVLLEVMALPEAQRQAVILVYIEGFSYKEASDILDIPIGTVMSRLSAARGKLAIPAKKIGKNIHNA